MHERKMKTDLTLSVRTDKTVYRIGEDITILCTFENPGPQSVKLLPSGDPYAARWIRVFDSRDRPAKEMLTTIVELWRAEERDFVVLEPSRAHKREFRGKISTDEVVSVTGERYRGLSIRFDDSALLLPQVGRYRLRAEYTAPSFWIQEAKARLGQENIFEGSLRSNWATISIEK
jgi:hypothetical protein